MPQKDLEVWKFGGASLADAAGVRRAVNLIAAHPGPLVIVASALAGITDLLIEGASRSTAGEARAAGTMAATFLRRHRQLIRDLLPSGPARRHLLAVVDAAAREYRDICIAVGVLGHLAPRASDRLVSRGERMSARILAAVLSASRRRSVYAEAVDIVVTDGHHGGAAPNLPETARRARRLLRPLIDRRVTPVVPGSSAVPPTGASRRSAAADRICRRRSSADRSARSASCCGRMWLAS